LAACHPQEVAVAPAGSLDGTIASLSGTTRGSMKITVTEQKSGLEIAVIDSDSKGRFGIQVPPGDRRPRHR
jgi:hypothetical protein